MIIIINGDILAYVLCGVPHFGVSFWPISVLTQLLRYWQIMAAATMKIPLSYGSTSVLQYVAFYKNKTSKWSGNFALYYIGQK